MTPNEAKKTVLIVDDEDEFRQGICTALTKAGYEVFDSPSGPDAIVKVSQEHFNAIISDIRMPEMSGLDLVHVLGKLCEDTIVILLTAVPDPDSNLANLAKAAGVYAYLNKPCKIQELIDTMESGFAQQESSRAQLDFANGIHKLKI